MEIWYENTKIEKLLTDHKKLVTKYGIKQALLIEKAINDLESADNLQEIFNLGCHRLHWLKWNRKDQLSIDLEHPDRLIFYPVNNPDKEFRNINKICIIGIVNTHGK